MQACGGTNGYDGINKAYELAEKNLKDGNNRIILCTDGDFNIGPSSTTELEQLVTENAAKEYLSACLVLELGITKTTEWKFWLTKAMETTHI